MKTSRNSLLNKICGRKVYAAKVFGAFWGCLLTIQAVSPALNGEHRANVSLNSPIKTTPNAYIAKGLTI